MRRQLIAEEAIKQQQQHKEQPVMLADNDLRLDLSALTARLTLREQAKDTQFNAATDMIKCWELPGTRLELALTNLLFQTCPFKHALSNLPGT